jgi:signal transduction histidine kinase
MAVREELTLEAQIARLKAENEELRRRLMQAQRMTSVGALAFSITHEFNNILTTVINYAKMGLRHKESASREKSFDRILTAGQRAARITTGLLAFARNKETRFEPTDLVQLAQDVLVLVEKDLQNHRIRLETVFDGRPFASTCGTQIQQVLLNLIINARQAMSAGTGQLTVGVRLNPESTMAEISVRDTGSGIPADKLATIFEPFFTTKTADGQGQGGTGLGLALCREIIEAHQGRIRVESAVGKGTVFTLKFPAVAAPTDARKELSAAS